ncbi:molybdopterin converting factor subunit 1 [Salinispirillum marinum]|uniref:Molybdopterin synthase sulfur carrier subunit n=2 Tax=Saccharospirillaceae TaxID=255527 RepID=A0ABV8B9S0_9GAMM
MNSVRILFFARLRETLPQAELEWPWASPGSVGDLKAQLRAQGDAWAALDGNILCAVNQTMVKLDAIVQPGDEVAFFPPVTGG